MANENKCRTCGHCWEMHSHCGLKICCEVIKEDMINPQFCECKTGWIPGENLEYLEWKYGRKLDKKFSN